MAATVRLATRRDVPLITAMVHELAEVEGNASACRAAEAKLDALLFTHAPFEGPTVFLLEVDQPSKKESKKEAMSGTVVTKPMLETSEQGPPVAPSDEDTASVELMLFRSVSNVKYKGHLLSDSGSSPHSDFLNEISSPRSSPLHTSAESDMEEPVLEVFRSRSNVNLQDRDASMPIIPRSHEAPLEEIVGEFSSLKLVSDPESALFRSSFVGDGGPRIVVGYVHVFPNYSTYLAKPGMYMEAFHIREPYRKLGLGTAFLRKMAREAVKLGMERIEWSVRHSNDAAVEFFQGMGAVIKPGFRKCGIDGEAMSNCQL